MGKYIIRPEERPSYSPEGHRETTNRLLISRENVGASYVEVVLGEVSAGGLTEAHSHEVEQAQYMIEGRARVEIEGEEPEEAKAGDIIFFPAGKVHRISPAGSSYKCLVIYAPPRTR